MADKADYLVREDGPYDFTITKWEGSERPTGEYHVTKHGNKFTCDCPGALNHRHCKHKEILEKWIKDGKKVGHTIEASGALSTNQMMQHRALWEAYKRNKEKYVPGSPAWQFEDHGDKLHALYFETLGQKPEKFEAGLLYQKFERLGMTRGIGWVSLELNDAGLPIVRWINLHDEVPKRPLLILDCWEHAYMVDFQATARRDYIQKWWTYIDWSIVEKRMSAYVIEKAQV